MQLFYCAEYSAAIAIVCMCADRISSDVCDGHQI